LSQSSAGKQADWGLASLEPLDGIRWITRRLGPGACVQTTQVLVLRFERQAEELSAIQAAIRNKLAKVGQRSELTFCNTAVFDGGRLLIFVRASGRRLPILEKQKTCLSRDAHTVYGLTSIALYSRFFNRAES